MKTKTGEIVAYEFVNLMRSRIEGNFFYSESIDSFEYLSENKIRKEYFEVLLKEPIILYARKNSLKESTESEYLNEHIDKISNYNKEHVLIMLSTLPPGMLKKLNVKWIMLEDDGGSKTVRPYDLGLLLKMIQAKDKASGQPSYNLLESFAATNLSCNYNGFKKKSDSFFINLFDIKTLSVYEASKFKYNNIYERNIPKEYKYKIFKYQCPICEHEFKVSLNCGVCAKHKILDEFLKVEEEDDKQMIVVDCDHSGTDCFGKYKKFGLDIKKHKNLAFKTKEDIDIIFLHMFDNFRSDGSKIKFWKSEKEEYEIEKDEFFSIESKSVDLEDKKHITEEEYEDEEEYEYEDEEEVDEDI